jgi:hypothetical protein
MKSMECVDFFERMWKMWIILNGNNGKMWKMCGNLNGNNGKSGKMCEFVWIFLNESWKSGKNEMEITVKCWKM